MDLAKISRQEAILQLENQNDIIIKWSNYKRSDGELKAAAFGESCSRAVSSAPLNGKGRRALPSFKSPLAGALAGLPWKFNTLSVEILMALRIPGVWRLPRKQQQ